MLYFLVAIYFIIYLKSISKFIYDDEEVFNENKRY